MATQHDIVKCSDCEWFGDMDDCNVIKHFHERVSPGEICPAGECPECGALAHIDDDDNLTIQNHDHHKWDDLTAGDIVALVNRKQKAYRENAARYENAKTDLSPFAARCETKANACGHILDRITAHKMGIRKITDD